MSLSPVKMAPKLQLCLEECHVLVVSWDGRSSFVSADKNHIKRQKNTFCLVDRRSLPVTTGSGRDWGSKWVSIARGREQAHPERVRGCTCSCQESGA